MIYYFGLIYRVLIWFSIGSESVQFEIFYTYYKYPNKFGYYLLCSQPNEPLAQAVLRPSAKNSFLKNNLI